MVIAPLDQDAFKQMPWKLATAADVPAYVLHYLVGVARARGAMRGDDAVQLERVWRCGARAQCAMCVVYHGERPWCA